ncbi:MAG TPA: glycine betaine ABC transporter substrate-binding protein [Mycobacteriales bacterium]|nr:glycine betaine ABC transporter substrate-binding protein [Mycobacteriales bacterium]
MPRNGIFNRTLGSRVLGAGVILALAATVGACGSSSDDNSNGSGGSGGSSGSSSSSGSGNSMPGKGKPAIVMGDKNFAEEYLLGELYSQALKAKGYTVTLKGNIGASAVIDKALTSGKIDMYPEYTGVIYTELAKLGDRPKSAEETLKGATKFENGRGFEVLKPTPFQDADGLAVTNDYAKEHSLKTISDMSKVGSFTYGGPPENKTRFQGVVGLKEAYGLNQLQFKPLTIGSQYQALDQGKIDSIAIFTTDGQLASKKYTVLTDTKGIFGYQQVVPVIKKEVLAKEGPEFAQILNDVSSKLTTDAIVSMNKAVQIDQKDPGDVAKAFLEANHLA